ncbi:unnamed protein product [Phaedon cochleariae]|uniref:Ig-like domain-containing protein n=1 Tax=Phaedon cochleariae TaxID=80249 RepID=A0A9N9SKY9_PHACE|nr:unnamed protein product [Phaedon cochleariae]
MKAVRVHYTPEHYQRNCLKAKAKILGPADLYVQAGSSIALSCIIPQGPHDLGTVSWYKGEKVLEGSEPRVNDANYKERLVIENQWTDVLSSRMQITRAHLMDSGNYSCVPTTAGAASVNVHIINGEHPAAMQHGTRNTASPSLSIPITIVYSLFIILIKHGR